MLKVCLVALLVIGLALAIQPEVFAKHEKACKRPNEPPKKLGTPANPMDKTVKEDARPVVYLALVGGDTPKPNDCGLKPKNGPAEWTGWGGPLDADNMTIGEGGGTRNDIVIGGVYYERGIGTHTAAKLIYDLTGRKYSKFEAWAGMADEKDGGKCAAAPECGHGGSGTFVFSVDGKEMLKTPVLKGCDGNKNVAPLEVKFDIPASGKEFQIDFTDGGDGASCDHSVLGDAKLLTPEALAVDSNSKLPSTWGDIKRSYQPVSQI